MNTYVTSCFILPDLIDHCEVLLSSFDLNSGWQHLNFHKVTTLTVSSCVPYFSLYAMPPLQAIIPVLNKKVIHRGSWSGGKKCEHGPCS